MKHGGKMKKYQNTHKDTTRNQVKVHNKPKHRTKKSAKKTKTQNVFVSFLMYKSLSCFFMAQNFHYLNLNSRYPRDLWYRGSVSVHFQESALRTGFSSVIAQKPQSEYKLSALPLRGRNLSGGTSKRGCSDCGGLDPQAAI